MTPPWTVMVKPSEHKQNDITNITREIAKDLGKILSISVIMEILTSARKSLRKHGVTYVVTVCRTEPEPVTVTPGGRGGVVRSLLPSSTWI